MTTYLTDPLVQGPHQDGSYTIPDPDGGEWTLRDTAAGWVASRLGDDFDGARWASAEDAAHAVLDLHHPPAPRTWGA
ncbi:MAG TPA: hypothetical protein VJT31_28050 [Rugosimonospora sp.]|nr:hypothetical protein [Rugosimonospora sp.]